MRDQEQRTTKSKRRSGMDEEGPRVCNYERRESKSGGKPGTEQRLGVEKRERRKAGSGTMMQATGDKECKQVKESGETMREGGQKAKGYQEWREPDVDRCLVRRETRRRV